MNSLMKLIREAFSPKKSELELRRRVLERDPDLRQIRRDHKHLEARVSALEIQAKVRARRI